MDIFVVDETNWFRRSTYIDNYESFIWTDRYSEAGEFSLKCEATQEMHDLLRPDVLIGFSESDRLMQIDTIKRTKDESGRQSFNVQGSSVEAVLEGRAAKKVLNSATWDLTGTIGSIIVTMVHTICIAGTGVHVHDVIPNMATLDGSGGGPSYTAKIKAGSLYARIKELADAVNLGFKMTYTAGYNQLLFSVYKGEDRTLPGPMYVAFSSSLESISDTSYIESLGNYKTGAYVFSNFGNQLVGTTGDTDRLGLKRRILLVDATDVAGPYDATHVAALQQRGRNALSEHLRIMLYDGKVSATGPAQYNVHYFMGDIVDLIDDYGTKQPMRVTEHIWSADSSGFSSYPTLSSIGGV